MIVFWVAAGILSAAAAGFILSRAARAAAAGEAADPTPILYRRQLAEIDELAERGLIGEAERRSAHTEAARRLLAAADAPKVVWTTDPGARKGVLAAVVAAPALALGIYLLVGAPGMPDQPFAARMKAWRTANPESLDAPELAAVLKQLTRERPNSAEGFRLLAMVESAAQDPPEAVRAARHAVELAPQRPDVWETLGEALVVENGGQLTDEARRAFQETLKRDPHAVVARFQLARARIESGDKAGGLTDWKALLAELPVGDQRRDALEAAIHEAEAGPQPAQPRVSADQLSMIKGMVEGLAQKLKANPDDPDGWVRLVRAYSVLGDAKSRDAALAEARIRFRSRPDVLEQLDAAAKAEPMK